MNASVELNKQRQQNRSLNNNATNTPESQQRHHIRRRTSKNENSFHSLLSRLDLRDGDDDEHCFLLLDFRNSWPNLLTTFVQIRHTPSKKSIAFRLLKTNLHNPRNATIKPYISIVAIHGIGAHPDDTWCKKVDAGRPEERYVNWLSNARMLPAVVPQARIMRYGYESQWFGEETISLKASTVAQRLLRSLTPERKVSLVSVRSGRVRDHIDAAQTIVDAKRSGDKWPGIYKSTIGILFFGTPFRGAGGLNQSEMLLAIQSQYDDDQIQGSSLNILAPGNETLMDLMELFFETRQDKNMTHVACFFEQKPSNVGAIYKGSRIQKFVVDESSGCLDQSESTEKYLLSRDHFNMNKFGKPTEEDFQTVREAIETMVEQAPALLAARDQRK
ncbi:MAG: hypothetical protein Q9166_007084 [cf. Caloplaca sp. 2 TL-2023]